MVTSSGLAENQVVQLLPPEYQGYVVTAFGFAMGAVTLYFTVIAPLLTRLSSNKALLASKAENESLKETINMNQAELDKMINTKFSNADKLLIKAKISELKVKLPFTDEQGKIELQARIDEMESALNV